MTLADYFVNNVQLRNEWASNRNAVSPDELTPRSRTKVWWRCGKGHEWKAALDSRIHAGRGCPYCANQAVNSGENDMASMAPRMVKLWHPTRNGDITPADVMAGSGKKFWWRCEKGHEWQAKAYTLKAGCACPYCAGKLPIVGETDLATTHPHVVKMWSPRNKLAPTEVTSGSHKKVWLVCERGHEWETQIGAVAILDCSCPYCAGKRAIPGETDLATVRPDILREWDYEKNTLDPKKILPSIHSKVWWRCELGHSYDAVVFSRTKPDGSGCPYCTGRKVLRGFNDLATLKPKLAKEWYSPLNGDLRPEDVSLGSNKKVWWRCAEGHVWQAFIYARTKHNGTGCPVCAGMVKQKPVQTERPAYALSLGRGCPVGAGVGKGIKHPTYPCHTERSS